MVWQALFAPVGVPKQVIDVLVPAAEKTFKNPEVMQRAARANLTVEYMGPDEVRKLTESGIKAVRTLAREADLVK